ncbi:MAG: DUF1653 domain-containing protein [Lachnospiraceae bacterium]|nr:DUF1653 domain-containing protein [Lachnospiraceae bacterium]
MRETPKPYERYRHFKGNLYQILTTAKDAGSGKEMVVYQALYGNYTTYVRSLEEFMSPTDKNKYPQAEQEYRFEKVTEQAAQQHVSHQRAETPHKPAVEQNPGADITDNRSRETGSIRPAAERPRTVTPQESAQPAERPRTVMPQAPARPAPRNEEEVPDLDPAVLEYLDAKTNEEKLNILASVRDRITDDMINTMAIATDVEIDPGPVSQRYESLKYCLLTKDKFEKVRLR